MEQFPQEGQNHIPTNPEEHSTELDTQVNEVTLPKKASKFGKMFRNALAATAILTSLPTEKAYSAEPQDNRPSVEHTAEFIKRHEKANSWLQEFGNPDITIGQPHKMVRSPIEQIGIYHKGIYLNDLHSQKMTGFGRDEFVAKLSTLLDTNGISHNKVEPNGQEEVIERRELTIGPGVTDRVLELGMTIEKRINSKGKQVVALSANTQLADKSKAIYFELDVEDDGRPDSYAKLSVASDGLLILEGKDGEPFHYEFNKGDNGEVIIKEKK